MSIGTFGRCLAGFALCVALTSLSVGPVSSAPDLPTTSVALDPQVGPPTGITHLAGSGFGVDELVDIAFDSTESGQAMTDGTGAFRMRTRIPPDAIPGSHQIEATGESSGRSATASFLV